LVLLCLALLIWPAAGAQAQILVDDQPAAGGETPSAEDDDVRPFRSDAFPISPVFEPFGNNLFTGNFVAERDDALNPDYLVATGDRLAVQTWGAVVINEVFIVDGQGNIFLPEVGPVRVLGVRNSDLTDVVRGSLRRVYRNNFDVYTNLLSTQPVGVYVTGFVKNPGNYAGVPTDSVLFFLDRAGGIDPDLGSYRKLTVLRDMVPLLEVDLYDFLLSGTLPEIQFRDGDTILVAKRGPVVVLEGSIARPSLVEMRQGQFTGRDVLDVVPESALATAVTLVGLRGGKPVNETFSLDSFRAVGLHHGDRIELRDDGNAEKILVRFEGEFAGPSVVAVRSVTRLLDLLNYIPVDPDLADLSSIHVLRESVREAQKKAINESLFRLERAALLALSASQGEVSIRVAEAQLLESFVKRAREVEPLGRVVTTIDGMQQNLLLEDGDVVVIPRRTSIVQVGGEVMIAQAILHRPDATAGDYIELVGGYTNRSDEGNLIILHASGQVARDEDEKIFPGDQILVMPRIDEKTFQNAIDLVQVIAQVAVSAGVFLAL
jgi:protein involved in polysaccharide export with SLBB domain